MNALDLDGQRILVIFLNTDNSQETYVLAGQGRATLGGFALQPDAGEASVALPLIDVEKSSFDPTMLARLIGREETWNAVSGLARGVSRCIPTLVPAPAAAVHAPDLIATLMGGPKGELFLMQVR